jgi:multidrug resistance efflux pump
MIPGPEGGESQLNLAEARRTEVEGAWKRFGSAATPEEFCQSWLALQCHIISDVNDGVVVLQKPGAEAFAPLAFWPEGRRDRSHLAEITERALRDGRGIVQPRGETGAAAASGRSDYQLAYPVRLDGRVRGVIGLDIVWREEAQLQAAMRQLQWGSGWLEVMLRRHADPMEAARLRLKLLLQLVATFLERPDFGDSSTVLVTEVAAQLGCDRVALGLPRGNRMRIEAVSHAVQFDRQANVLRATEAAMIEALDQGEPIVYPPDRDGRLVVTFAHAELAQMSGAGGVATVPLVHNGRKVGALTLARAPGFRFDAPAVEMLEGLASILGPLVDLRLSRQRSLPAHAGDSAKEWWQKLAGPRHGGFKLACAFVAALALFLSFAKGSYRASADTRIEGEIQRAVTAPFQGYVRESFRRAGDTVRGGELLARMDDRDLKLERIRVTAQRDQLRQQYQEAMAIRERARARIVSAQVEQAEAQLALIEEQLARTGLVAPFDGVVVSGDLTQVQGAPLERGQVLFEVAPLASYRVVLNVDEHDVADVKVGQRGELVLSSNPGTHYPVSVTQITPVSTAREGRNFFRVEARLESEAGTRLRPGMEGVAKIDIDERRLIWIWTRGLVDWIRLKIWAWMP